MQVARKYFNIKRDVINVFLPGFFVCLVPFCSGVRFGCAALAEVFWASFSRTDRGTVGMGGSFSLHDSPSASVSAFVILWNKGEKKSFERLILCVVRECGLMDDQCICWSYQYLSTLAALRSLLPVSVVVMFERRLQNWLLAIWDLNMTQNEPLPPIFARKLLFSESVQHRDIVLHTSCWWGGKNGRTELWRQRSTWIYKMLSKFKLLNAGNLY